MSSPWRRASSTSASRRSAVSVTPGGVLKVGDRVEELRRRPGGEHALELVDRKTVLVDRDTLDERLEALERHDRAQVGRRLDEDAVALVDERLAEELERLDRAAREHELALPRPPAFPLDAVGHVLARAGEPVGRRVLER